MKEVVPRRTTKEEYHKSTLLKKSHGGKSLERSSQRGRIRKTKFSIKWLNALRRKKLLAKIKLNRTNSWGNLTLSKE